MVKVKKHNRIVGSFTYRDCEEIIQKNPRTKALGSGTHRELQRVTDAIIGMEKGRRMDRFMHELDDQAYCDRCFAESQQGVMGGPIKMVVNHMQIIFPKTYVIYLFQVCRPRQQQRQRMMNESMV